MIGQLDCSRIMVELVVVELLQQLDKVVNPAAVPQAATLVMADIVGVGMLPQRPIMSEESV